MLKWCLMLDAEFEGDHAWASDVVKKILEIVKKELNMDKVRVSVYEEVDDNDNC